MIDPAPNVRVHILLLICIQVLHKFTRWIYRNSLRKLYSIICTQDLTSHGQTAALRPGAASGRDHAPGMQLSTTKYTYIYTYIHDIFSAKRISSVQWRWQSISFLRGSSSDSRIIDKRLCFVKYYFDAEERALYQRIGKRKKREKRKKKRKENTKSNLVEKTWSV